ARLCSDRAGDLDAWLATLVDADVLVRRRDDHAFRHALLRDGAYATLTPADARAGHQLAAEGLTEVGEADALVLASHFERGTDPPAAAPHFYRAAFRSHVGGDQEAAADCARRGLACGATGALRGSLNAMLAIALTWRQKYEESSGYAREALREVTPGSGPWARATALSMWPAFI